MHEPITSANGQLDTRDRLLWTAMKLFGARGFDGVAVRDIAKAANANVAAVNYHFGGKWDLYLAVIGWLLDSTDRHFDPLVADLSRAAAQRPVDPAMLSRAMAKAVAEFFGGFFGRPDSNLPIALIMREYANPTSAFDIIYSRRVEPLHLAFTNIVAAALGQSPDAQETIVRAHAMIGQIMVFGLARAVIWRRLDWTGYDDQRIELITGIVVEAIQTSLNLPLLSPALCLGDPP